MDMKYYDRYGELNSCYVPHIVQFGRHTLFTVVDSYLENMKIITSMLKMFLIEKYFHSSLKEIFMDIISFSLM